MLRHNSRNGFFQIFKLGNIFENFDQKGKKSNFFANKSLFFSIFWYFLAIFGQNFQKY